MSVAQLTGPWDGRVRAFRSADADCFAVLTERYAVVVDTFMTPQDAAAMMALLRGELRGRQLLVVNTHQHSDHTWGNAVFGPGGAHPAPILAHQKSAGLLRNRAAEIEGHVASAKAQSPRLASVRLVPPSLTFSGRLTLHGGDLTLELIPAPGHAEDQVVVWIPEIKTLLAADALEFPFPYAADPADLPALLRTMRGLRRLGAQAVLPCHGGPHGPELIEKNLEYFALLKRRARAAKPQLPAGWEGLEDLPRRVGLPFEAVLEGMGLSPAEVPAFYRDFHLRNARATLVGL